MQTLKLSMLVQMIRETVSGRRWCDCDCLLLAAIGTCCCCWARSLSHSL